MKAVKKSETSELSAISFAPSADRFADDVNGKRQSEMNMDWESGALRQPLRSVAERAYDLGPRLATLSPQARSGIR